MKAISNPQALLILLVGLMFSGLIAAFLLLTKADYEDSEQRARRDLTELTLLLEEHTRVVLNTNMIQLKRVISLVGDRPLSELRGSESDQRALIQIHQDTEDCHSIWIFDEFGKLVLTTSNSPGAYTDVSDRDFFKTLKDTGQPLLLSPLMKGREYGGYYFVMSRPINDAAGNFRGVVQSSIKIDYFADFYRQLAPRGATAFTIVRDDGALVMRWPLPNPDEPEKTLARAQLFTKFLKESPTGLIGGPSPIDGVERMVAYRKMRGAPLVVLTAAAKESVFSEWMKRTIRNSLYGGAASLIFLILAAYAFRSLSREAKALSQQREKANQLARALEDNDVLFQELHHRIKNNLQIISSFLTMQRLKIKDSDAVILIQETIDRIHSMGLVHQTLYLQQEAAAVDVALYLRTLADYLSSAHYADQRSITIDVKSQKIKVGLDTAVPLALAVNEAMTNALKHAFPKDGGRIEVDLAARGSTCEVSITDDGVGIPATVLKSRAPSIGIHLLRALAGQLDGKVVFSHLDPGTRVTISFPLPNITGQQVAQSEEKVPVAAE